MRVFSQLTTHFNIVKYLLMIRILQIILFSMPLLALGQNYTSYFTGNEENLDVEPEFGICLMGGGVEDDNGMTWFLERANGGDVVVIRSSGSDGYNDYMYEELGVSINSVETIIITSVEGANDPYVIDKLNQAEAIWIAGGDQYNYVQYWRNTPVMDILNNHINVKEGVIGGTSAGMAILGEAYFSAENGTVTSEEALANPFRFDVTLDYDDFMQAPFMENTITETHFNDPDRIRYGRIVAFMARLQHDYDFETRGMAANEHNCIAIDENGIARAFGEYPQYQNDLVYFLHPKCFEDPEIIEEGTALTWDNDGEAVKVYRLPATEDGSNYFDLSDGFSGSGGTWENWYVINGELFMDDSEGILPDCLTSVKENSNADLKIWPNPATDFLNVSCLFCDQQNVEVEMFDLQGKTVPIGYIIESSRQLKIDLEGLSPGIYFLALKNNKGNFISKVAKQ